MPRMTKAQIERGIEYYGRLMTVDVWRETFSLVRLSRIESAIWAGRGSYRRSFASISDNITTGYNDSGSGEINP